MCVLMIMMMRSMQLISTRTTRRRTTRLLPRKELVRLSSTKRRTRSPKRNLQQKHLVLTRTRMHLTSAMTTKTTTRVKTSRSRCVCRKNKRSATASRTSCAHWKLRPSQSRTRGSRLPEVRRCHQLPAAHKIRTTHRRKYQKTSGATTATKTMLCRSTALQWRTSCSKPEREQNCASKTGQIHQTARRVPRSAQTTMTSPAREVQRRLKVMTMAKTTRRHETKTVCTRFLCTAGSFSRQIRSTCSLPISTRSRFPQLR
mmetsp:Transcript_5605/g.14024  ORF Transcript_5605/g.14024 Transcript_5605/m.14024 type:complete len:258 (-) Transcript_5605:909-1682(-)